MNELSFAQSQSSMGDPDKDNINLNYGMWSQPDHFYQHINTQGPSIGTNFNNIQHNLPLSIVNAQTLQSSEDQINHDLKPTQRSYFNLCRPSSEAYNLINLVFHKQKSLFTA